jgi:glycerol-3-phosphate dehydrogenase
MIPETEDGRVLFVLPWEDHALVGTTDEPADISEHPRPLETEIAYLLRHVKRYFNLQVERADIKAVWSGLRPLVSDPKAADTAHLARDHVIEVSEAGLLTIAGGKWTTYRLMAEHTVDHALKQFDLPSTVQACQTEHLPILGGAAYAERRDRELIQKYHVPADVAAYLNRNYGDQAEQVVALADAGYGARLAENHPFLEAEVLHAVRFELAERVIDVLARRMPLALLDTGAARIAAPRVLAIMAEELSWDGERCEAEARLTEQRLSEAL